MQAIEHDFEGAVKEGLLPGVLLAASNRDGSLNYFKSFGKVSLENGAPSASSSTTLILASATKIVTCVAAMQCVERGLVELDQNISKYLPEWEYPMVLTSFDEENDGKPILEHAKTPITLRHLLSHTSGITGLESDQIMQYYNAIGNNRGTLIMRYFISDDPEVKAKALGEVREVMETLVVEPLIFEPGTKWGYGQSTGWAGQIVERVTHMTLEGYCQENIFKPLGMNSTTFRLLNHPHAASNLMKMHARNKEGKVEQAESIYPIDPKIDMGSSNLYTSAPDFMKLLTSLMRNDGELLRPETADIMFNYRLPDMESFNSFKRDAEEIQYFFGDTAPDGMQVDHCLAGMVVLDGLKGGRKAGSVSWGGATSCFWWIDRASGICGFYGSQSMLMGDQQISTRFFRKFEQAIYATYAGET